MTASFRSLPILFAGLLLVSGCGPNLVTRATNPLSGGVCGLLWLVLAVLALSDLWKSARTDSDKVLWTVVIVVLPVMGSLAYYFIGRKG